MISSKSIKPIIYCLVMLVVSLKVLQVKLRERKIKKPARNASSSVSNASPARQPDGSHGGGRSDAGWHSDAGGQK
ncbi:hypothetical protein KJ786_02560 [Patescibacteria group bacterium]|nr:hypothetical protein [Patescibacteria group bacterium]